MTEAWWRSGGSVPRINHPPGRATKAGIGCGAVPRADEPLVRNGEETAAAANGKEIRRGFVSGGAAGKKRVGWRPGIVKMIPE